MATGVAALIASRGFGTTALGVIGFGLIALPPLVWGLVSATAAGLGLERRIAPARGRAGEPARVSLTLTGWPARAGAHRLVEVSLDPGLESIAGRAERSEDGLTWILPEAPRGDHHLPPPRLRVCDAFGLARRSRVGGGDDRLLVLPMAPPLPRLAVAARADGHGPRRRALTGFGELDRVRDYRAGDPLSRVHWAQTAKRGRLQTKELRASEGDGRSVTILLDAAAPPGEDFETAVTAAAAVARYLSERREPMGFAHTGPGGVRRPAGRATWPEVELALAQVVGGDGRDLALAVRAEAAAADSADVLVVVTSSGEPGGLAAAATQARGHGVGVVAVLVGPAAAGLPELARTGAEPVAIAGRGGVAAALSETGARAHVS
jgi:uncharacterized protein (DUF58 family)